MSYTKEQIDKATAECKPLGGRGGGIINANALANNPNCNKETNNQGGEVGATENVSYDTISPLYTPPKKKLKIFIKNNSTLLILGGIVVGAFFLMKIK
tara:strand:+ start:925 stop:1218 length:294 start_codon:yes stop_codon:yes gene_type:complete